MINTQVDAAVNVARPPLYKHVEVRAVCRGYFQCFFARNVDKITLFVVNNHATIFYAHFLTIFADF